MKLLQTKYFRILTEMSQPDICHTEILSVQHILWCLSFWNVEKKFKSADGLSNQIYYFFKNEFFGPDAY